MIQVTDIKKKYKKLQVINGVSFSAGKGECVGIIGANGCGKSTLLSILAGSLRADAGSLLYDKKEALGNSGVFTTYVGYVPQENPLMEDLTVKDNLRLWYACAGKDLKEGLRDPLMSDVLQITPMLNKTVNKLSGGMKKRVSIACALCNHPPIMILDEPSSSLDLVCKADVHQYMQYFMKEGGGGDGGTIIITSHDVTELALCHKLYLLKDGILSEVSPGPEITDLVGKLIQS